MKIKKKKNGKIKIKGPIFKLQFNFSAKSESFIILFNESFNSNSDSKFQWNTNEHKHIEMLGMKHVTEWEKEPRSDYGVKMPETVKHQS